MKQKYINERKIQDVEVAGNGGMPTQDESSMPTPPPQPDEPNVDEPKNDEID